jgi:peptidoglycan/xylan/chitin deacetylase (PgdA/CDA1 family)
MNSSNLLARLKGRYIRSSATLFYRQVLECNPQTPIISFTFDDFPRSALHAGGSILNRHGLAGTYYASFGLMGREAPTGTMFLPEDLPLLFQQGHEIGCHTFDHCHSWDTSSSVFEDSILKNHRALQAFSPGGSFKSFSYPISPPRPQNKQLAGKHFLSCRGGDQKINFERADLNYLFSSFLEKNRENFSAVQDQIDRNKRNRGWLIFSTHDVSESPTPYGCTPAFFERVVQAALNSGARILPVAEAVDALRKAAPSLQSAG